MKSYIKNSINFFRNAIFNRAESLKKGLKILSSPADSDEKISEIIRRIHFFDSNIKIELCKSLSLNDYINFTMIGLTDSNKQLKSKLIFKKDQVFDFDFNNYYLEGWDYHRLLYNQQYDTVAIGVKQGKEHLKKLKKTLAAQYNKAYIFGTGPSLEKAIEHDWSDGIRIVSNTIVRDVDLWTKINPHFITAGDGIYHFGTGKFPQSFRNDLRARLKETETYFVFPDIFYPFCLSQFPDSKDKLIPVPYSNSPKIHADLTVEYALPTGENVLPMLLLPLAATLSKNIYLWGFDGRSPNDKLFWKNSSKQFYPEHVDELMKLHPAFYSKNVPKESPESYAKKVHGDSLDQTLTAAEKEGFTFNMMHFSNTKVLQDRNIDR